GVAAAFRQEAQALSFQTAERVGRRARLERTAAQRARAGTPHRERRLPQHLLPFDGTRACDDQQLAAARHRPRSVAQPDHGAAAARTRTRVGRRAGGSAGLASRYGVRQAVTSATPGRAAIVAAWSRSASPRQPITTRPSWSTACVRTPHDSTCSRIPSIMALVASSRVTMIILAPPEKENGPLLERAVRVAWRISRLR